jgi:phosphate:Na+ symporter
LGIGVPLLFFKQDKLKFLGEFLTGLGLLFIGLDSLKNAFELIDLKNNQEFIRFITNFGDDGFRTTLLFVLIGSVLTVIVQSSSAAMALTLTMIDSGLPLHLAAAIVLGENIGTTVTANFAAMVANTHAKRAARAHFIFNIFGAIWMICIFDKFIHVVYNFINEICYAYLPMESNKDVIRYSLAFFHTSFNIINTLLLIGFIPQIEKIVIKMVPASRFKPNEMEDDFKLEYISAGLFNTSELGLLEAEKELEKFAKITQNMLYDVEKLLMTEDPGFTEKIIETIKQQEILTDQFEEEIIKYLTRLSTTGLSDSGSVELRSMLSVTYDLERIGDLCCNISNEFREKNETHTIFTAEHKKELLETIHYIHQGFEVMLHNFQITEQHPIDLSPAYVIESNIDLKRQEQRKNYLEKIKNSAEMNVSSEISYNNIFYFLSRIGNHLINVSEALAGKI